MRTIEIFRNTPTQVYVKELPPFKNPSFNFGFNPGKIGDIPTLSVNVSLVVSGDTNEQIKIATHDPIYKIKGEGLILEDHIYTCCQQAIHSMKIFLQYDQICRSIPQEIFRLQGKEVFGNDLIDLAKAMNAIEGKRGFPSD